MHEVMGLSPDLKEKKKKSYVLITHALSTPRGKQKIKEKNGLLSLP